MNKNEQNTTSAEAAQADESNPVPGPATASAGGQPPLTPEQLEELKQQAAKAVENWDRLLRTTADFDNFKKRATREKQDAIKYANENLLEKLLPVLDNFEMAIAAARNTEGETARALHQGVDMVLQQFKQVLKDSGLEEVDASEGVAFNPNVHEAIATQESPKYPEGHVLQQMRKGYLLRDRLIRPASVVVSKAPAQP